MKVAVYSTKSYDEDFLTHANSDGAHQFTFIKARLDGETARLAAGHDAVCPFVNDTLDERVINELASHGVRLIAMRCAGYNNVDIRKAAEAGLTVARVPEYSPYSVAEHAMGMILCLNRQLHRSFNRVRERNFELSGLLGFDLRGKTVGVLGTGRIGTQVAHILLGFGCQVIGWDRTPSQTLLQLGVPFQEISEILPQADIITLHCPLTTETHHLIDEKAIERMKPGVMIINTSRGALLDTKAVLQALKSGKIGYLGLDVYEEEAELFFEDRSGAVLQDDIFARLLTFNNVLVTGHQAFFTKEALTKIAQTTVANLSAFETSGECAEDNCVIKPTLSESR